MARFFFIQDPDGYKIEFCSGTAATADWEAKMSKHILDRRGFLRSAGAGAAAVVALSGVTTILASNRAWAMTLESFGPHEAEVLLQMTRQLYPHDRLGDIYYAEVVESLDQKAKAAPELVELVKNGVAALDQAKHVPFLQLSDGYQTEVLAAMEAEPFFQTVRGTRSWRSTTTRSCGTTSATRAAPGRTAAI